MLAPNTYQVVQKQCNQPLRDTVASLVGDEGLPFVRDEGRPGWRIILAADRKQYEAAGWKVQGIAADEARQRPMLKVSPPHKQIPKPDFFDDSQTYNEFCHKIVAILEEGLRLGISREHVKILAGRAVAAF
jgi:hypothetical protein